MGPAIRILIVWVLSAVYWPILLAFYVITLRRLPEAWRTGSIRLWGRATAFLLGVRVELETPYPFTDARPRVLVINHQSALDVVWGAMICPPAPLVIGKKEVIYIPLLNLVWWAFGFIHVDRKNSLKALRALQGVAQAIRASRSLIIAPEGTRSPDGLFLPFKKGAFHLSMQSGAPVFPIVVCGAYELMPKKAFTARPGVIRLRFLSPENPPSSEEDLDAWVVAVRGRMIAALSEMQRA
jgi:1-acyl-sn-glycerol-3-phosphate acyltransferase